MRGLLPGMFVLCVAARSFAQPAEPDYSRATDLYNGASKALDEGRGDDAARDFLAAYDITKDPVLFFKIGSAYEKAGKCSDAIGYYERYLAEAKPEESFVTLTKQRIDACKATLPKPPAGDHQARPESAPDAAKPSPTPAAPAAEPMTEPSKDKDRAWLFVGASLAFITTGAVLAYSAESAEQDIKDLYVSSGGSPPEFDAETKERYDDLVAEGNRYQYLSWASFGLAAGCAVGATIFFLRDRGDVTVTPVVTPKETGVSATLRF
jgi:tetratricopeptide (TPR) repeat protein